MPEFNALSAGDVCPDDGWQQIKNDARGQTVWFNAWGGDNAVNQYLDWVSGEMKTHYAINLKIVRLADAADAVKRIQTEAASGRKTGVLSIYCGLTAKTSAP